MSGAFFDPTGAAFGITETPAEAAFNARAAALARKQAAAMWTQEQAKREAYFELYGQNAPVPGRVVAPAAAQVVASALPAPAAPTSKAAPSPAKPAARPAPKPAQRRVGTNEGTNEAANAVVPTTPAPMVEPQPVVVPPVMGQGVSTGPIAPQAMQPRIVCNNGKCQEDWSFITGAPNDGGYINQVASGGPIDPITAGFMADFLNASQQSRSASIQSGDALYRQQITQTPEYQAAFMEAISNGAATPSEAAAIAFGRVGMPDVVMRNPNDLTKANESRYRRTAAPFVTSGTPMPYQTPGYVNFMGSAPQANGEMLSKFGLGANTFSMPTAPELASGTAFQFMGLPQGGVAVDPRVQAAMLKRMTDLARIKSGENRTTETNKTRVDIANKNATTKAQTTAASTAAADKRAADAIKSREKIAADKAAAEKKKKQGIDFSTSKL